MYDNNEHQLDLSQSGETFLTERPVIPFIYGQSSTGPTVPVLQSVQSRSVSVGPKSNRVLSNLENRQARFAKIPVFTRLQNIQQHNSFFDNFTNVSNFITVVRQCTGWCYNS